MIDDSNTIVDYVLRNAEQTPDRLTMQFRDPAKDVTRSLSCEQLVNQATRAARSLKDLGCRHKPVVISMWEDTDWTVAFYACLLSGCIPVPCPVPGRNKVARLLTILKSSGAEVLLADTKTRQSVFGGASGVTILCIEDLKENSGQTVCLPKPEDIAFVQFTSGSTSNPKGVVITHANVIANQHMIHESFRSTVDTRLVSWLPLFHDMGLVGTLLQAVFLNIPIYQLPTLAVVRDPYIWLRTISDVQATTSGGPNFIYEQCLKFAKEMEPVDLSSWTVAYNGSEPVKKATLDRFAGTFRDWGFKKDSFLPCYGMAEATLFISGKRHGEAVEFDSLEDATLVSCGAVASDLDVCIYDNQSKTVCTGSNVGEVLVSGPSVFGGYLNLPDVNQSSFVNLDGKTFFKSGDLGYLQDGALFICGRMKEMLIVNGKNVFPYDIEVAASESSEYTNGRPCACVQDIDEKVVVLQELDRGHLAQCRSDERVLPKVAMKIRGAIVREADIHADKVVLLKPGRLPRTTSGKIKRVECQQRLDQFVDAALAVHSEHGLVR